jgi:predicted metalloprotease
MTFRPDVDLDPGRVRDSRGRRVRGGGLAVGGGLGTLVIVALILLTGGDLGDVIGGLGAAPVQEGPIGSQLINECETGTDANERQDCRLVGALESLDAYWSEAFATSGESFQQPGAEIFTDGVNTRCGAASSAVGPFYCPLDQHVYLDLGFYDQLQARFGAEGGPLAEGYVVAHEYGHHVENLLGVLEGGGSRETGAESTAVRIELMADCLAGIWAHNAEGTGFLRQLTRNDIAQALDAAAAVGDDRIQERVQGQVTPETWTHGSSEQRQQWFLTGYEGGRVSDCDTFQADL